MGPSSYKVANRFLIAREWGDPRLIIDRYRGALAAFRQTLEKYGNQPYTGLILARDLRPVLVSGLNLAEWVVQTRVIPAGKAKAVELAVRLMVSMKRIPGDIPAWYAKNSARLDLLLEVAKWGDRSEGQGTGSDVVVVAPFKVHNTIGADDRQFGEIQGLVKAAVTALKATLNFGKVLYGDVYIVGQLKRSKTLAWYSVTDDEVYVRSLAKKGFDDLQSLTHELGHRYWFKFATLDQKKAVISLYYQLLRTYNKIPDFKEGDRFPLPLSSKPGAPPMIVKVDAEFYHLSSGGKVKKWDVAQLLRKQMNFPSVYSERSYEEFFAECFAFYTLGKLKPDLRADFEAALKS